MAEYTDIDDAAAAALYMLELEKRKTSEHIGLIYRAEAGYQRTPTQSRNDQGKVKGRFNIPAGTLSALFHNHPVGSYEQSDSSARARFSGDDISQADRLGVPSYISAGSHVFRYDPRTQEVQEVLAQFPIEELKRHLLAKGLQN